LCIYCNTHVKKTGDDLIIRESGVINVSLAGGLMSTVVWLVGWLMIGGMSVMAETGRLECACPVCTRLVKWTRIMIIDHEPSIIDALEGYCQRMIKDPEELRICHDLVKEELPEIIDLLRHKVDPLTVCRRIHMCPRLVR